MEMHQSFYLVNSLLGVWVLNLPYIYLTMRSGNKKEVILEESYIQGLVGLTGGIGCTQHTSFLDECNDIFRMYDIVRNCYFNAINKKGSGNP